MYVRMCNFIIHLCVLSFPTIQTIQEWHMFILVGILLTIDMVFLAIVTAVPEAIHKLETRSMPILVSLYSHYIILDPFRI